MKIKKSLMLSTLASVATVGVLTPIFTVSACGNKSTSAEITTKPEQPSTPGGSGTDTPGGTDKPIPPTGDTLPQNYTEAQYENAINAYSEKVKSMSVEQMISEMNTLSNELTQASTAAFDGFDGIVSYTPTVNPDTHEETGGWALKNGKTIEDVYNFFANLVNKKLFPTWENFNEFFKLNSETITANNMKIMFLFCNYMFNKSVFNVNKIFLLSTNCINSWSNLTDSQKTFIHDFGEMLEEWYWTYNYSTYLHLANNPKIKPVSIDQTIVSYHSFVNSFITQFIKACDSSGLTFSDAGQRYTIIDETNGYGYLWPQPVPQSPSN